VGASIATFYVTKSTILPVATFLTTSQDKLMHAADHQQ